MTRSVLCLSVLLAGATLLLSLLLPAQQSFHQDSARWQNKRDLVAALAITDLSLSSEARYTRHVSQADLFSAFQDFPASFEHFPTGSMIPPRPAGYSGRVLFESAQRVRP
ncbi:MAG: hypothetical protein K0A94_08940 [Desulfuromonadales bacterium]|nr:hypothetical protein [Desulfuromonadales bacterium]